MARKRYTQGFGHAARVFRFMSLNMARDFADQFNRSGREMTGLMKRLVPVSDDQEHVRDAIAFRVVPTNRGIALAVWAGDSKETIAAAWRSEYGRAPGGEGQAGHPGHASQRFFWPAYYNQRKRIRARLARMRTKIVKEALQRAR